MFYRNFLQFFHPNTALLAVQHWNNDMNPCSVLSYFLSGVRTHSLALAHKVVSLVAEGITQRVGSRATVCVCVCVGSPEHRSLLSDLHSLTWPGRATWAPLTILIRPAFRRTAKTPGSWHQLTALHAPQDVNGVMLERLFLREVPPPGRVRTMEQKTELDLRQVPVCSPLKTWYHFPNPIANDDCVQNHSWHLIIWLARN